MVEENKLAGMASRLFKSRSLILAKQEDNICKER